MFRITSYNVCYTKLLREGVDIETCSEGGYNVGWSNNGEWLEYTVNITTTGNYTVKARAASNNNNCKFDITFSNGNKSTGDYNFV